MEDIEEGLKSLEDGEISEYISYNFVTCYLVIILLKCAIIPSISFRQKYIKIQIWPHNHNF